MAISAGDILSVVPSMHIGVQVTIQNVYHTYISQLVSDVEEDILQDMADWMDDAYSEIVGHIWDAQSFDEVKVIDITADIDIGVTGFPVLSAGGATGHGLPPGTAALVKFKTIQGKHQGRKYIGVLTEDGQTDGTLIGTAQTALANFATVIAEPYDGSSGNQYKYVVLDRTTDQVRYPNQIIVPAYFAYQRRRRPGVGI